MRQFALFCVSGALAFLVDAGVVHALVRFAAVDPYVARGCSFLCAVTFTWAFNRGVTFAVASGLPMAREWGHYVTTQLGGFAVNFAVYAALVWELAVVRDWPAIGVAAGSLAGLLVNFLGAKHLVFARARATR